MPERQLQLEYGIQRNNPEKLNIKALINKRVTSPFNLFFDFLVLMGLFLDGVYMLLFATHYADN